VAKSNLLRCIGAVQILIENEEHFAWLDLRVRAGKWLRKNLGFFQFFKKPKKPKFRFLRFF